MSASAERSVNLVDELRSCFLFESLDDAKLAFLAGAGRVVEYPEATLVYKEGDEATCFFVLLHGEIQLLKRVGGEDEILVTSAQRGAYGGATRAFVPGVQHGSYPTSVRTVRSSRLYELPADTFAGALREWFPMAVHLLDGLFLGLTNMEALTGQREKLMALGALSAGLAHELNNPASAGMRGAQALRKRIREAQEALGAVVPVLAREQLSQVIGILVQAVERAKDTPPLSAVEAGDREDELGQWLDDHDVEGSWDLAPTLAASGIDVAWLESMAAPAGEHLGAAVRWVAARLEIDALVDELEDASTRISTLVGSIKEYSHMDRAAYAATDVHDGIESTLVMLGHKLKQGVEVVREYDRTLPAIPAYGSELNQVWTNLIDNAVDAMEGKGRIVIRTARDGDRLLVEIADNGPGIPPELQRRVFEPFFTTKGVGKGTGLGLDIAHRVVAQRHRGDIRVTSEPGDTRFQVRLPLNPS